MGDSPSAYALRPDEVHIWSVPLDRRDDLVRALAGLLSPDEAQRQAHFYFERERRRFAVARGMLRVILGQYLSLDPRALRFEYGALGKPFLAEEFRLPDIQFNLAHSNELAVIGVTVNSEIGVDVEFIHELPDFERIASTFFSPSEKSELLSAPPSERQAVFFEGWTRKEAFIKLMGKGLGHALDQPDFASMPMEPDMLNVESGPQDTAQWSSESFVPAPGYVAAFVVKSRDFRVTYWPPAIASDLGQEIQGAL